MCTRIDVNSEIQLSNKSYKVSGQREENEDYQLETKKIHSATVNIYYLHVLRLPII